MGFALYVSFEREVLDLKGWDMCGKTLARNIDALDQIAQRLNLQPLGNMISMSTDDVEGLLGDESEEFSAPAMSAESKKLPREAEEMIGELEQEFAELEQDLHEMKGAGLPDEQWFSPSAGLETVRGLLAYVETNQSQFKNVSSLVADLKEVEHYLAIAEKERVRFHMTPDF